MSDTLRPHGLYSPWNSPGQNTGVGSLSLLQGIFPTQGWNPGVLHCGQILYQLSHKGSPKGEKEQINCRMGGGMALCFAPHWSSCLPGFIQWKCMGLESGLLWGYHHSTAQGVTWLGHLYPHWPQRRNPRDSSACNWSKLRFTCEGSTAPRCCWVLPGNGS